MVVSKKSPMKHHFYLKKWLIDIFLVSETWYLADFFSKINEVSLSLQEKQLTILAANDKIQVFKQKSDI